MQYVTEDDADIGGFSSITNFELIRKDSIKKKHAPLLESIISTRMFQCTDPRDAVYSMLGLGGDIEAYGDTLIPNYSLSVAEVYKKFVTGCIIQKGSLYPLSVLYIPPASEALDLPSWVPDFTRLEISNPLIWMRMGTGLPFHASGLSTQRTRVSSDGNILYAWGKVVDKVTRIGLAFEEVSLVRDAGLTESEIFSRRLKDWLDIRKEIAGLESADERTSPERFEEFWRTLILNLTAGADRPPPEYSVSFQKYFDFISGSMTQEEVVGQRSLLIKAETAVFAFIRGWRFCATENGRLGQGLKSLEVGDVICILYGGELLYAIRPLANCHYKFIGSCYIHGLMDGEACAIENLESEEFAFY